MPSRQEDPQFIAHLQRINKQLGGDVIGIETGDDRPIEVRINHENLASNFMVIGKERPEAIQKLFKRQADGIRQLLEVVELSKEDRVFAARELFYTQVLLLLIRAVLKITKVVVD